MRRICTGTGFACFVAGAGSALDGSPADSTGLSASASSLTLYFLSLFRSTVRVAPLASASLMMMGSRLSSDIISMSSRHWSNVIDQKPPSYLRRIRRRRGRSCRAGVYLRQRFQKGTPFLGSLYRCDARCRLRRRVCGRRFENGFSSGHRGCCGRLRRGFL